MALGAPRATKAVIANPGWNSFCGGCMGGGCQGKKGVVQYAHAVPPSRNAGAMTVFVQWAYFSAWSRVFEVPSRMSVRRVLPCGLPTGGFLLRSFRAITMALGA